MFPNSFTLPSGKRYFPEITPKPVPYDVLAVPNDGRRYMFLVEDYKVDSDEVDWDHLPRSLRKGDGSPLPATVPTDGLFSDLNEPWQRTYFELCRKASFNVLTEAEMLFAYKRTTRDAGGWRDRHTWEDVKFVPPHLHTDYILRLNLPPLPTYGDAAQKHLLNSRNIIRVIREDAKYYYYEALDTSLPPPPVDEIWGKWWLAGWMSQSTSVSIGDREWAHTRWPYFGGYGAPYLVLGRNGANRVRKYWCRPIKNGESFSPYTP